ncbi:1-deoxy-D-xylulose-5-phosphate synthase [Sulfidibacter corallicola]|uniref:1-deoxy-D-xylulose-5-phosphate synthase n=1 Tax=Sulfidibacter corallicola TaxID=2818388 RepID=A0A8A4TMQ7_SULCO|nr:1-deoxy-D-xylulose-5-phosphate synthase [Sulfidibacter corallicola]QTD50392.1 1-deoxy-D-xylulose-5-phosphate synthase [Sulfidibacter corallicola]
MIELLNQIDDPQDLKTLSREQLPQLAEEIRNFIKNFTNVTGGHIGSGMGVVELTIALHYLFEFKERDHLIMDVGHQCYPHKILTGRRDQMGSIRQKNGLSGFPDPKESPYDRVKTGHGGTSLNTAVGMAVGLKNAGINDGRKVVAMLGDAGLQEGSALEALNYAGVFDDLPLIIVLNDNEHGIGPSVGAFMKYFSKVRSGTIYRTAKGNFKRLTKVMESASPFVGKLAYDVVDRVKSGIHGLVPVIAPGVLFEALGYFYYGPIDGHDLPTLLEALEDCKSFNRPVVLHCITTKGKGYSYKQDRLAYHAGKPSKKITAHLPNEYSCQGGPSFTEVFVDEAIKMAEDDPTVCAITAAMLEGTGLVKFKEQFPDRCYDVGMAEQHAVGMAQGLALVGQKPICAVYSTFMQRAIDQIFQEVALIDTPVMFCLDRAGVVGPDGATHNGVFDITYCRMFPNMVVMAPRDGSELRQMMRLAMNHDGPTAIRFPRTRTPLENAELPTMSFKIGQSEQLRDGNHGCILAYGVMVYLALDVATEIYSRYGIDLAVVNARFAKPLDDSVLGREFDRQPVIFTLEDHNRAGGFGSAVLEHANAKGYETTKLEILAIEDRFIDHGQRVEALAMAGLDVPSLVKRIEERLGLHRAHAETEQPHETKAPRPAATH